MAEADASDAAGADGAKERTSITATEEKGALRCEFMALIPADGRAQVQRTPIGDWRTQETRITLGGWGAIGLWDSFARCVRLSAPGSGWQRVGAGSLCSDQERMPQRLKPGCRASIYGTTEVVPSRVTAVFP